MIIAKKQPGKANKLILVMISHKAIYIFVNGPQSHKTFHLLVTMSGNAVNGHRGLVFAYLFAFT